MSAKLTAMQVLDGEFLEIRCRILDIAAALDRVERGSEVAAGQRDPRRAQIEQAIRILSDGSSDRARRVQMVFSLEYEPAWRGT